MLNDALIMKTKVTLLDGFECDLTASLFLPDKSVKAAYFLLPGGGNTKDYLISVRPMGLTIHSPHVCVIMALQ